MSMSFMASARSQMIQYMIVATVSLQEIASYRQSIIQLQSFFPIVDLTS